MSNHRVLKSPETIARWIWTPQTHPNQYVAARGAIKLQAAPTRARLRIFADTKYKLYVNGRFVNAGPASFRKPVIQVDEYDVAPFLRKGANEVFVVSHFIGATVKYNTVEEPGLIVSLEGACVGGAPFALHSGASWKVAELDCWKADTPRRTWAIEHVEDLDLAHPAFALLARHAAEDYAGGGERGATAQALWTNPRVFARVDLDVRPRGVPTLAWTREDVTRPAHVFRLNTEVYNLQDTGVRLDHETVRPALDESVYEMTRGGTVRFNRREGEPGFGLVYDMRRMCAGEVSVDVVCDAPCTLDVALAEKTLPDGHPVIWRNGGLYFARYHLAAGLNRVRGYHFNGHRYIYLVMKDVVGAVDVRCATTHHCRAALDFKDVFACDDRAAESLYRISRRSIALNTQADTYDCNTREQGAYWGDSIWIADSVGHQTGDFRHMRRLCDAMTDEFRACGMLPASLYGLGAPLYDYCLVPVELLARYHRYTGDAATVKANLPAARAIVGQFRAFRDPNGLLAVRNIPVAAEDFRKGLLFLDHPGNGWHPMTTTGIERADYSAGFNLYFLQALQALAGLERAGGRRAALEAEIATLAATIRKTFLVPARGLLADSVHPGKRTFRFSQIANALAITTGVLDGAEARHALATVLDIPRNPWVSQGSPYTYFFLADAAVRTGQVDLAVRAFVRDFSGMLASGATTTWEAWNADNHDSLNHAWSAPLPLLVRAGVMGVQPARPGYAEVVVRPSLDSFNRFEGTCCIPQGVVGVSWCREETRAWALDVTLPKGVPGILQLPGGFARRFKGSWQGRVECATPASQK